MDRGLMCLKWTLNEIRNTAGRCAYRTAVRDGRKSEISRLSWARSLYCGLVRFPVHLTRTTDISSEG